MEDQNKDKLPETPETSAPVADETPVEAPEASAPVADETPVETPETSEPAADEAPETSAPAADETPAEVAASDEQPEATSEPATEEQPETASEPERTKPKKEKRPKAPKNGVWNGLKLFRTIWYGALAVLTVVLLVLTCIDVGGTKVRKTAFDTDAAVAHIEAMTKDVDSGSIYMTEGHAQKVDYLKKTLREFGLTDLTANVTSSEADGITRYDVTDSDALTAPAFAAVEMILTGAERYEWEQIYRGTDPSKQFNAVALTDIVAYFPSTAADKTNDVIMMMAHYDSVSMGPGANDDLSSVGAMLETIRAFVGKTLRNDVLFVFTDGEEYGMLGAYALKTKFDGFGGAWSRVGFGTNFESRGNGGTDIMFQSSSNNYNLIKNYSKLRTTIFLSSVADFAYSLMPNYTDFAIYEDVPALNFSNIGGGEVYHTQLDSKPYKTLINNHGAMMFALLDAFGNTDLSVLTGKTSGVYFSYLDWGSVVYPNAVAYVLGALLLAVLAAGLVVSALKKTLDIKGILKGLAIQVATLVVCLVLGYALYYVCGALLAGFGAVNIHALSSLAFSSQPLLIFFTFTVIALGLMSYIFFKRIFLVKAGDVVRGNVVLWALLGAVLSFAMPAASYLFVWVALFESVILLLHALLKDKFRAKIKLDPDRFFPYVLPVIVFLPMTVGVFLLLGDALGGYLYPVIALLGVLLTGFLTPYFDYLKPVFDKAVKKLPRPKERAVQTVTEEIDDPDHPGRKKETTYRKTFWRKRDGENVYKNRYGIIALALVGFVVTMCVCAGNAPYSWNIGGKYNTERPFYDDAVIFGYDNGEYLWKVTDLDAYRYISKAIGGWTWDASRGAYIKNADAETDLKSMLLSVSVSDRTTDGNDTSFSVLPSGNMQYTLTFDDADSIESVTIASTLNGSGRTSDEETYYPVGGVLKVTGLLGSTSVTVHGKSAAYSGGVTFDGNAVDWVSAKGSSAEDNTELRNADEAVWPVIRRYFEEKGLSAYLKGGIEIRNYKLSI